MEVTSSSGVLYQMNGTAALPSGWLGPCICPFVACYTNTANNKATVDIRLRLWCAISPSWLTIDSSNTCKCLPLSCAHCYMDHSNSQFIEVLGLSGMLSPKNCLFPFGDRHQHVTHCSRGQAHSSSQTASQLISAVFVWVPNVMLYNAL